MDEKTRILLVEDNPADARLFCELLSEVPRRPFEVSVAGTLREGVASSPGHHVILLDLSLPDALGLETVSRMASAAPAVPIIVLTGNTDDEVALDAALVGADDYLLKRDITPSLLARTILYAIERRRSAENARRVLALEIARAENVRAAERARFLADLSAAFATKLDLDEVVRTACAYVVPELGDYCVLDLARQNGGFERVAAHASSEHLSANARRLMPFAPYHPGSPIGRAIAERRSIEVPDITAAAAEIATSARHLEVITALDARSALVLPLLARDRVVGALTLLLRADRELDDNRRALADEVARRTAIAVDNALLYRATQRALSAREELVAVVSHDLRNPLSVFSLALQQIRLAAESDRPAPLSVIERAARSVKNMERLITDLLDVASIDAGTFAVRRSRVDLVALLREAVDENAALAAEREVRVEAKLCREAYIDCDRDRLMQVVANLLGNALKFTPPGGAVVVACAQRSSSVEVSVSDTGPGIAPANLPYVFDRFYQSDRKRGGVGLGLAIAKGIIDAHGGSIGVESQPGNGARFFFVLPARFSAETVQTTA